MAAYCLVDDLQIPAGWLPVHRDQLRAQHSVSSMGAFTFYWHLVSSKNSTDLPSVLWHCWLGGRKGIRPIKNMGDGGGGHWLVQMEWRPCGWSVPASVNLPLHHKVQKFSSGTGSPRWSRKKAVKWLWWRCQISFNKSLFFWENYLLIQQLPVQLKL